MLFILSIIFILVIAWYCGLLNIFIPSKRGQIKMKDYYIKDPWRLYKKSDKEYKREQFYRMLEDIALDIMFFICIVCIGIIFTIVWGI